MGKIMLRTKGGMNIVTDATPQCWLDSLGVNEDLNVIPHAWEWADVAVALKMFPSKGQARKNGWGGDIERGYTERKTKRHGTLFVAKATDKIIALHARYRRRHG
jgi:hypothetical protein